MKKFISVLLCVCIIGASCVVMSYAKTNVSGEISDLPVIMVAGYASTSLYKINPDGSSEHAWGIDINEILSLVLERIVDVGRGLGALTLGNAKILADTVGQGFVDLYGDLALNPDGTSVEEIHRYASTAAQANVANIKKEHPDGDDIIIHERDIIKEIEEYVADENIFIFQMDWRMGQLSCAKQLDEFVDSVLEYTGRDKVNIYAVSHGGQTTATYLALYGNKNKVNNAVLTIPAIGGAGIAYDLMVNNVRLDEDDLIRFIEHGTMTEADFEWLVKAQQLGFIDNLCEALVPYLQKVLGYWGSIWDFIPSDKYEETKSLLLDSAESAKLIEECDKFHYQVLPSLGEKFAECRANGTHISILAGTGNRIVTGLNENSDGIITVACSTGATVAPFGTRFADGYTQINPCGGKYKVSPSMDIDASTAFLPDNTWFVEDFYHGMTLWDYYTIDLAMTLLLTDRIEDVYSDPDYPQFRYSSNPSNTVYADFNTSNPGFVDGSASKLIVTNVNRKHSASISAITCSGADLEFNLNPLKVLKPGESIEVPFSGNIPAESKKEINITVFFNTATITPSNYRTFGFTVMNGDDAEYGGGYVPADHVTPFDEIFPSILTRPLAKLGLLDFFRMIFNIVFYWANRIF